MVKKKGLKKFDISNKLAYTLMVVLSIALLGISVVAYNMPPPTNVGHTLNELATTGCTNGQVIKLASGVWACGVDDETDSRFTIGTSGDERGKLCYNNPYSSCTTETLYCAESVADYVSLGTTLCTSMTQSNLNAVCQGYCYMQNDGKACDGSVSGCSGTAVYWTSINGVCLSGSLYSVWCMCSGSGDYTQATSIPAGTRCI